MIDLSFTGGSIYFYSEVTGDVTIREFSDEGSPVEVDEIEVAGYAINMNGLLIRWRKPSAYVVKLSVIPGSDADSSLMKLLSASHVEATDFGTYAEPVSSLKIPMLEIYAPSINNSSASSTDRKWRFDEGCMVSGSPAVTADAEGKMNAKTYTLVFERMAEYPKTGTVL